MKTAILPPIRVDPKTKKSIEAVLQEGESLSSFILQAATTTAAVRRAQQAFIERALAGERRAENTGTYVPHDVVMAKAEALIEKARRKARRR